MISARQFNLHLLNMGIDFAYLKIFPVILWFAKKPNIIYVAFEYDNNFYTDR